jgi:hypothetical protein
VPYKTPEVQPDGFNSPLIRVGYANPNNQRTRFYFLTQSVSAMVPVACLLLSMILPPAAFAQSVDGQVNSFEGLPLILKIGQEVKVSSDGSRATQGKVVSISGDQLVVSEKQAWFGLLRPRVERTFIRERVGQIDSADSNWNGALFGGAAAFAFTAVPCALWCESEERGLVLAYGIILAAPVGMAVGAFIDRLMTKSVYKRPLGTPRVVFVPQIKSGRTTISAEIRF